MADGIQFGIDALRQRTETHRCLFVITDGEPNPGHEAVIQRQIRLAEKMHISVIGVGIGVESKQVMQLFPDHVWVADISEMPMRLLAKLNERLDFRGLRKRRTA